MTIPAVLAELAEGDELVVVDNASSDGTAESVARLAPEAVLVTEQTNLGFAEGINRGAAAASGDLLVLLNPDAVPQPGFREGIVRPLTEGRGWAAWQGLVTAENGAVLNTPAASCTSPASRGPAAPGTRFPRASSRTRCRSSRAPVLRSRARPSSAPAASTATTSCTTRTSTSRCACASREAASASSPRPSSTTTTSSRRPRPSTATSSATAGRRCCAPIRGRCSPR